MKRKQWISKNASTEYNLEDFRRKKISHLVIEKKFRQDLKYWETKAVSQGGVIFYIYDSWGKPEQYHFSKKAKN